MFRIVVLTGLFLGIVTGFCAAADWPQWRGPTRDGMVAASPAWPSSLTGVEPVWRVPMGRGYSGPVVVGDRVFTVETEGDKEIVRSLDLATGKQLWQAQWEGQMSVPFFARRNGNWVRATPACDGQTLYVAGMRDVLAALDVQTGRVNWQVDFVERYKSPLPSFGFVCSPLVIGDALYVQAGASFVKLDKRTGQTIWRTLEDGGGMWGSAFSSPMLATLAGQRQLLVQTRTILAGVEEAGGKVLWSVKVPAFRGMNILNPTAVGDAVFTSSYGGGTFLFKLGPGDGSLVVSQSWKTELEGYMSTPIVIDGHAYLHGRDKRFHCVRLSDGSVVWQSKEKFGEYWSLASDGRQLLALDQKGELLLIRPNAEKFDLVDRKSLTEEETWAHLAVVDDLLLVRELKAMTVYRWTRGK